MGRAWEFTDDCCARLEAGVRIHTAGSRCIHSLSEDLIVCVHGVPLRPVSDLTPEFLERHESEKERHLRDLKPSVAYGWSGLECPLGLRRAGHRPESPPGREGAHED